MRQLSAEAPPAQSQPASNQDPAEAGIEDRKPVDSLEKDQQPDEALMTEVVEPFWFSELLVNKPGAHPRLSRGP